MHKEIEFQDRFYNILHILNFTYIFFLEMYLK